MSSHSRTATVLASNVLFADDDHARLSFETLEELDWCLEQLESIQTHRSVADMASTKVKRTCMQKSIMVPPMNA